MKRLNVFPLVKLNPFIDIYIFNFSPIKISKSNLEIVNRIFGGYLSDRNFSNVCKLDILRRGKIKLEKKLETYRG